MGKPFKLMIIFLFRRKHNSASYQLRIPTCKNNISRKLRQRLTIKRHDENYISHFCSVHFAAILTAPPK